MVEAEQSTADGPIVIWRAQPGPQSSLVSCPVFEVFFGGSRGGGKTDGMLGDWIRHSSLYGEHAIGLMVRRERTQLIETIERSKQVFIPLGAKFNEQKSMWVFSNGARLRFSYLERDADADNYQGHSYTRIYAEELGTFPNAAPILKLMATLRSGAGVPCGFRATGNPGGPGHNWVKARYIDPAPAGWQVLKSEFRNPFTGQMVMRERIYIPSRLSDNKFLGADYVANLQMAGSENLVKAWLEGDWDIVDGAFFDNWQAARHVIRPFTIPADWLRFRAMDWGSARPFSVGWYAVVTDPYRTESGLLLPRGCLLKYREYYGVKLSGTGFEPNVGLKMTAEEVAAEIRKREKLPDGSFERLAYGVADPAIFSSDGGPSIAERMIKGGVSWRPADNKRVAGHGAMGGWDQLRQRLNGDEDGNPMLAFFSTCIHSIRTIPALQHDSGRPEDVDTDGEDHAADETRYACMSRPWIKQVINERPARPNDNYTRNRSEEDSWKTA